MRYWQLGNVDKFPHISIKLTRNGAILKCNFTIIEMLLAMRCFAFDRLKLDPQQIEDRIPAPSRQGSTSDCSFNRSPIQLAMIAPYAILPVKAGTCNEKDP